MGATFRGQPITLPADAIIGVVPVMAQLPDGRAVEAVQFLVALDPVPGNPAAHFGQIAQALAPPLIIAPGVGLPPGFKLPGEG